MITDMLVDHLRAHREHQEAMVGKLEDLRDRLAVAVAVRARMLAAMTSAGTCDHCERCTWNPGPDCGKVDHPHCPRCFHCQGRHESDETEGVSA